MKSLRSATGPHRLLRLAAVSALCLFPVAPSPAQGPAPASLRDQFKTPPPDSRIMVRWWWFGPATTKPEITRELEQMKAGGIGGVEIANLYPLRLDDPSTGFHNQPFLSDEHIEMMRWAADEARRLGLRVDVTLGSGWPFGGPHIPVTQNAGVLRTEIVPVDPGLDSVAMPNLSAGEKPITAFLLDTPDGSGSLTDARQVPVNTVSGGRFPIPHDSDAPKSVMFFIASRTGMAVKRPSEGAAGFVLDHYDPAAIANHLHAVGDRLLQAFGDHPPFAVFSDSLEVAGTNWTNDFLEEFRKRRGYDLLPHLPALVGDMGPESASVRHDWGKTLSELVEQRYLASVQQWAHEHHTLFRTQNYGNPPVTLSSYRFADLPEGEGGASPRMWRDFSETRWAASAAHLLDKPVVSSETWTWLHSPAFRATPLDMKVEADLHFLQGINQLIGHGWPYSPPDEIEPGQRMYAAAVFNAHNPWFFVMPDVAAYLQRVSFALRQGRAAANVAILMPNDDAWASFTAVRRLPSTANPLIGTRAPGLGSSTSSARPIAGQAPAAARGPEQWGNVSLDASVKRILGDDLIGSILDSGFSVDFIDPGMITATGIHHSVLILPHITRIDLPTYRKIEDFARGGGAVIALGNPPSEAPGVMEEKSDTAAIKAISQRLFDSSGHKGQLVANESDLPALLDRVGKPEVKFASRQSDIGFFHRKLPDGDLYFVANTSNEPRTLQATFAHNSHRAEWWDAFNGTSSPVRDPGSINEVLEPYGSRLLFFSDSAAPAPRPARPAKRSRRRTPAPRPVHMDLSTGWTLQIGTSGPKEPMDTLHSWSDSPSHRFYSGTATYEKQVTLSPDQLSPGRPLFLDLGPVKTVPIAAISGNVIRTRAFLDPPVRDAAEVWINGERLGSVWHPPFRIDASRLLRPGPNTIRIVVGNTAINELAGQTLPDYRLLRSIYGNAFQPQDMDHLEPLPSGLLGPVTLETAPQP